MDEILKLVGSVIWGVVGLILLIAELLVAGVYLMWFGVAALLTFATLWGLHYYFVFVAWPIQIGMFLIYLFFSLFIGIKYFRHSEKTDEPLLNQRTEQMLGQVVALHEAIKNGHGYVRLDDTIWRVSGSNMPVGTEVRLLKFENGAFLVEKAD